MENLFEKIDSLRNSCDNLCESCSKSTCSCRDIIGNFSICADIFTILCEQLKKLLHNKGRLKEKIHAQNDKIHKLKRKVRHLQLGGKDRSCREAEDGLPFKNGKTTQKEINRVVEEPSVSSEYIYKPELGLYYHQTLGYYYLPDKHLFYDDNTGTYFYYDAETQEYKFHSKVDKSFSGIVSTAHGLEKMDKKDDVSPRSNTDEELVCTDKQDVASESEYVHSPVGASAFDTAPSLRLMVTDSLEEKVSGGCLFVVTIDGGQIGRESFNAVCLPGLSISRIHATIEYKCDEDNSHHFYITDAGSTNGTYVNGVRLNSSAGVGDRMEIGHGWLLRCGDVTMKCHIHPGNLTCNECEPGLVQSELPSQKDGSINSVIIEDVERVRKKELKLMKKKYGIEYKDDQHFKLDVPYQDRAEMRRETVGSDNPYEKTQMASVDEPIASSNKGYQLLQKMGWKEGEGLGKDDSGIKEPIISEASGTVGFGSC